MEPPHRVVPKGKQDGSGQPPSNGLAGQPGALRAGRGLAAFWTRPCSSPSIVAGCDAMQLQGTLTAISLSTAQRKGKRRALLTSCTRAAKKAAAQRAVGVWLPHRSAAYRGTRGLSPCSSSRTLMRSRRACRRRQEERKRAAVRVASGAVEGRPAGMVAPHPTSCRRNGQERRVCACTRQSRSV